MSMKLLPPNVSDRSSLTTVQKRGDPPRASFQVEGLLEGVLAESQRDQRGVTRHVQRLALREAVAAQRHALQVLAACRSAPLATPTSDLQFLALQHRRVLEGHGGHGAPRDGQPRHRLQAVLGEVQRRQVAHLYVSAVTGTTTLEDQRGEAGAGALLGGHFVDGAVYGSDGAGQTHCRTPAS